MKTAVVLAMLLTGCLTEPKTVTKEYDVDCTYIVEADSTVTPVCHAERVK